MSLNIPEVLDAAVKHHEQGQLARAEQAYRLVLDASPSIAEAHYNLGAVLSDQGKPEAAIESFRSALRIRPGYLKALNNLGTTLLRLRRHSEAAAAYAQAVELNPRYAPAHCNLAAALRHLGRLDEALAHCERALEVDPRNPTTLNNLASVLIDQRRFAEACAVLRDALEIDPRYLKARRNLVLALRELGRLEEAFAHGQQVLAEDASDVQMMIILANASLMLHRLDEYVAYCEKWIARDPQSPQALESLGIAYLDQGRIEESVKIFDRALEVAPASPPAHYCRGMAYFFLGDYRRGWADYEWRWQTKEFIQQSFAQPRWSGEDLRGKAILVLAEQGLGDTLQFVRYLKPLRQRGARVIFGCQTRLMKLLASFQDMDELVADGGTLPPFDVHAPLLSLPSLLDLPDPKDCPQPPYLFADSGLIAEWKRELGKLDGIKVGINWQGDPKYTKDRFRSIPLAQFAPLAQVPGVRLISLQKSFGKEQLEEFPQRERILDLGGRLDEASGPFMDTAAVLHSLDLVITSDTALAHLAGALGRPVWLVLSAIPDWRWKLTGETTTWYPSMRVFRQASLGDWKTLFLHIASELNTFVAHLKESRIETIAELAPKPAPEELGKSVRAAMQSLQAGQLTQAEQLCRQILSDNPSHVDAWHLLGLAMYQLGRFEPAVEYVQQALRLKPDFTHAHFNLGNILLGSKRFSEAADSYRRCLQLQPDYAEAHFALGNVFNELGKNTEALECFQKTVEFNPKHIKALNNLGLALYSLNRYAESASAFERALQADPGYVNGHVNLVVALIKLGRLEEALTHCHQALALNPKHTDALTNLGCVLVEMGRFDEAVAWSRAAVETDPQNHHAAKCLGVALMHQGRVPEALEALDQSLAIVPDFSTGHTDRAMAYLVAGDFARGWPEYEWRRRTKEFNARDFSQPPWEGGDLQGKTLLVYAEQGLGDSLQFVRYLPVIRRRGGRVIFECPKSLHPLLGNRCDIDEVVPHGKPLPPFDFHAPLLSLPHLLGLLDPHESPAPPYLAADPNLITQWHDELAKIEGFKVGINWQGNPKHPKDHFRSIPLTQFLPLAEIPGVRLISLQKGFGKEQLEKIHERDRILDLASRLDISTGAFMDTAAVLNSLDLVITSDTALAHLAGALGTPCWVALPSVPDWRWLLTGDTTPWYPATRLFRQTSINDWAGVFERIAAELRKLVSPANSSARRSASSAKAPASAELSQPQVTNHAANVNGILTRALACFQSGDLEHSERLGRQVLAADLSHADAWHILGLVMQKTSRQALGLEYIREAIRLKPAYAEAHLNLANSLRDVGRAGEAVSGYRRCLELRPELAEAHYNLANALNDLGRHGEAIESYQQATRLRPNYVKALNNLGTTLLDVGRSAEARAAFQQTLEINPNYATGHCNLASALHKQGHLEEAIAHCRQAIALDPKSCEALNNLATVFIDQGKMKDGLEAIERALQMNPEYAKARLNRAIAWMLLGDYARGWPEYEWRWRTKVVAARHFSQPRWDGSDLAGKAILVHAEQGHGDTLHFVRYLPLVRQRGGRVLFECPASLHNLLRPCSGIDDLVVAGAALPPFDVHAPLLSLPHLLNLPEPQDSPPPPYLVAQPELIAHWRAELDHLGGFKVGINWQGNPNHTKDHYRSIPLAQFLPLAKTPGVRFISLQKGYGKEQLEALPERDLILNLGSRLDETTGAFLDTAAVLHNLDLIITSDTALAHLAGALGRPVWLALSAAPDWRWQLSGDSTPWYPSMRIFRQATLGNWRPVFEKMAVELQRLKSA